MNPSNSFCVSAHDSAQRLDIFLSQKKKGLSRSQVKRLIEKGNVQIGGRKAKAGMRLKENDVVTLTLLNRFPCGLFMKTAI